MKWNTSNGGASIRSTSVHHAAGLVPLRIARFSSASLVADSKEINAKMHTYFLLRDMFIATV